MYQNYTIYKNKLEFAFKIIYLWYSQSMIINNMFYETN